ncbi:hypothetical protein SMACR_06971 [Sordaria macrospora]|uniref:WGS project CABT00000000 data, contig 2.29 n=2 Tax=Sordaria macrospora TaxID=5147 RepID=F7W4X7_SORMK|nr:uncharacterized protein SMAC_06971 [Sordaria macrospora k-hell]KAA8629256.1 hypothetical protein SMACR_06971 [Sordaria macrospora]WPJ67207.1 hypothetical protein SMAC4_06971 [Sordaria macrospora]CCC12564.1 unnamed protein product [Sordaria macrospora k-hell]
MSSRQIKTPTRTVTSHQTEEVTVSPGGNTATLTVTTTVVETKTTVTEYNRAAPAAPAGDAGVAGVDEKKAAVATDAGVDEKKDEAKEGTSEEKK